MLKYPQQQNRVYHFPLDFLKHTFLFGAKFGKLKNPTSTYILWLYGSSLSSFSDSTSLFQLEFGLKIRHMSIILHQTRLLNTSCLPFVANLFNIAVNQRMEAITNPFNQLLLTLINFDQNVRVKVQKKNKKNQSVSCNSNSKAISQGILYMLCYNLLLVPPTLDHHLYDLKKIF